MSKDRLQRGLRVTFTGLLVNATLAGIKIAAGSIGRSHALLADGVESLADLMSSLIVWRGLVVAAAPADEDHPYGHGKAEPIAAASVAAILMAAALAIIIHSVQVIGQPEPGPKPFTLAVLLGVVLIKESLFRWVLREARAVESPAVRTDAWHHRSDAITSLAAAIGLTMALIGGPDFRAADAMAAIVAGLVIAWNGWSLLDPALAELMDRRPDLGINKQVRAIAGTIAGVERIEKCLVRKMGYHFFVDLHAEVDPQMTVREAHRIAHEVKDQVCRRLPKVADVLVHIEPGRGKNP